jgi:hypothetical protein
MDIPYMLYNAISPCSIVSRHVSQIHPNVRTCTYAVQAYMYARARPTHDQVQTEHTATACDSENSNQLVFL